MGAVAGLLAYLLGVSPASATVDSGKTLDLLAVGGEGHRYATVLETDLNTACDDGGCRAYHVDLHEPTFKRLSPLPVPEVLEERTEEAQRRVFELYTSALPSPTKARLARNVLHAHSLESITPKQGSGPVEGNVLGTDVRARLTQLWTVNSMNAYDRYGTTMRPCANRFEHKALCSACKETVRWLDGERLTTWECSTGGVRLDGLFEETASGAPTATPRRCECAARAHMYALMLESGNTTTQGSKVLVEPFLTWQDDNGAAGAWYDDTGLRFSWGSSPSVRWWLTPERRLIVLGSAVHLPVGNATHFPVFATMQM